jgi:uncharacterized protein YfbU (UPF0304 family)
MPIITITAPGVLKLLQNLNSHKATGPDEIPTIVLKGTAIVTSEILRAYNNLQRLHQHWRSTIILLDFSKAFDTVAHRRLLHKLSYYGISGKTIIGYRPSLAIETSKYL